MACLLPLLLQLLPQALRGRLMLCGRLLCGVLGECRSIFDDFTRIGKISDGLYGETVRREDLGDLLSDRASGRRSWVSERLGPDLDLRKLVNDGELEAAQDYMVGHFPLTIEVPDQIATQVLNQLFYELPVEELPAREPLPGLNPKYTFDLFVIGGGSAGVDEQAVSARLRLRSRRSRVRRGIRAWGAACRWS